MREQNEETACGAQTRPFSNPNPSLRSASSEFELRMLFVRLFRALAAPQIIRTVTISTKQPHDTQVPEGGLRAETGPEPFRSRQKDNF